MSDFISISYRAVNGTYFPSIVSDEAMTGEVMKKEVGAAFEQPHIGVHRFGMFHRFWHEMDMVHTRNAIMERQMQSNTLPSFIEKVQEHYQAAEKKLATDFEHATTAQLWGLYSTLLEEYRNMCIYAYSANLMDRPLSDAVKAGISELMPGVSEAEYDKYLLALTRNPRANFLYGFDLESIGLLLEATDEKTIDSHINKWKTLFVGSAGSDENGEAAAVKRFKDLKSRPVQELKDMKEEISSQYTQADADISLFEDELNIPDELKQKLSLLRESILLKETRKFYMTRLEDLARPLFRAIGQQINIEPHNIGYLLPNEVKSALLESNLVTNETIEGFKKDLAYVIQDGTTKRYIGKEVDDVIDQYDLGSEVKQPKESSETTNSSKELYKGFVSCLGYVEGPVKIVNGSQDFHKIKDGDILVTPITTPEYIAIFDMVKGMITFDGAGITSHPATLSREYKIPAILGVKELNGVLHDNDLVSVDANNNTVKILRSAP